MLTELINGRTIIEEQSFTDSRELLGSAELVDVALSAILDGLSNRPEGFDLITGYEPIRIAKTDRVSRPIFGDIPALRVWFVISGETEIKLLYVDKLEEEI